MYQRPRADLPHRSDLRPCLDGLPPRNKAAPRPRSTWEPWVTVGGNAYLQQPSTQQAWPVLEGWAQGPATFVHALALALVSAGKQQDGSQPISMQHWTHS